MKKHLVTAVLYTAITAILLGIVYPLALTAVAHLLFPAKADGQLLVRNNTIIGSHLLGQTFTGPGYFHSRPSSAGTGYDAANSSGSNLGPTSQALRDAVGSRAGAEGIGNAPIPVDLVTASGSGLDPDISPDAALYQLPRIAAQRHLSPAIVQALITSHITPRQFGLLGEPRVNVLDLNLALDQQSTHSSR